MNVKFKGTKGDWRYQFNRFCMLSKNGNHMVKAGEVGTPICIMPMPIGGINVKEKQEANARLIAAAPELLKTVQQLLECLPNEPKDEGAWHRVQNAKKLLAKIV